MPALLDASDKTYRLPLTGNSAVGPAVVSSSVDTGVGPFSGATLIGVGGMGVVYRATAPDGRTVAVKVIPVGARMDSTAARLEREWRTLATLDHPNVARVFESGSTADGRPYFTMEYIPGEPLGRFADERRMTVRQRLELFLGVAAAVAHLHRRGIIHRDLKPGNILVTETDGVAVPKLIDFGLAKLVGEAAGTTTIGGYVGTPNYMAPEQAAGKDTAIDTRADVYALGAILYELLAGTVPHARATDGELGILELILRLQVSDPPLPSARLAEPAAGDRAEARGTTPAGLRVELAGDLDRVVLKALVRDREQRYGTVEELAADVRRYLANESVSVGVPSRAGQFARFVRRNRALVAGVVAVLVLLTVAVAVTTSGLIRAEEAERQAKARLIERERAHHQLVLALAETAVAKEKTEQTLKESEVARHTAEKSLERFRNDAVGLGDQRDMLRMDRLRPVPEVNAAVKKLLAAADHPDLQPQVRQSLRQFAADTLWKLGDSAAAMPLLQQAYDDRRKEYGDDDPRTREMGRRLADLYAIAGKHKRAVPLFERHLPPLGPEAVPEPLHLLLSRLNQAIGYDQTGQKPKAIELYRAVLVRGNPVYGERHPTMASAALALAILLAEREPAEAIRLADGIRSVVGNQQMSLYSNPAHALYALGWVYQQAGRPDLAESVYERSAEKWTAERPDSWQRHDMRGMMADLQARQGNFPDAIRNAISAAEGLAVPPKAFDPGWHGRATSARDRVVKLCVEWGDSATADRWTARHIPEPREPAPPPRRDTSN